MPDPVTGVIAGGTLLSAGIGAASAKSAGDKQAKAGRQALGFQQQVFETSTENQQPFVDAGHDAVAALLFELGLGPAPRVGGVTDADLGPEPIITLQEGGPQYTTVSQRDNDHRVISGFDVDRYVVEGKEFLNKDDAQTYLNTLLADRQAKIDEGEVYGGFQKTQDYLFGLNEGTAAVEASAAARGSLNSGATLRSLNEFGQNFASTRRDNYLNKLFSIMGVGQNSVNALQTAGAEFATGAGNALGAIGNARSAQAIGIGNSIQGGINGLVGTGGYLTQQGGGGILPGGGALNGLNPVQTVTF